LDENLGYILGTVLGDGCICIKNGTISLGVIDKDFALTFKKTLEEWSGFTTTFSSHVLKDSGKIIWEVILSSVYIIDHLKNYNLNKIKTASKKIKKMFLKGMYDSEGSVPKDPKQQDINISNNNKQLLQFCKDLLSDLGIESNSIFICIKKGSVAHFPNNKKSIVKRNIYGFDINKKENLIKFRNLVGFSIKRKQNKLIDMINSYITKKQRHFINKLIPSKRKNWRKLYNASYL